MIHLDEAGVQIAYLWLVCMAWTWAVSQIVMAVAERAGRRWTWRRTTAVWMAAKAAFFTFVGSVWWFHWFDPHWHAVAIYSLAAAHTLAFVHWLCLPRRPSPPPYPAQEHR